MNAALHVHRSPDGSTLWRVCLIVFVLAAILAAAQPARAGSIIYVVPGGAGSQTGADWGNAKDLAAALAAAVSGDELWVKAGSYKPTTGTDRNISFNLKDGVAIYGGFAGTETARGQRNWQTNVTILSGDLNGDDGPSFANNTDNSYHVVTGNSLDASAVLDGFTVTGGNANDAGGGLYNLGGSPTLINVTISGNLAVTGGGIYNENGSPTLTNVTISGNGTSFAGRGAGIYNKNSTSTMTGVTISHNSSYYAGGGIINDHSSPTLTNVTISYNSSSEYGAGGMLNDAFSNPTLANVTFAGNTASNWGNGGGMANSGSPTLKNVVFSGNSAPDGGGGMSNSGSPTLTNVTFSGNHASTGGGIYNSAGSPTINNSILWGDGSEIVNANGGSAAVSYSIVQGSGGSGSPWWNANSATDGGGNLDADPKFIAPVPAPAPATGGNLRLQPDSPAINAGDNSVTAPTLPATDLDGSPRIVGGTVDLGAYEFLCPPGTPGTLKVNASVASGTGDASSWADASPTLAFALARAQACAVVAQVWVAQGTYKPTTTADRNISFNLKDGVAIYGGFVGGEADVSQRNWQTNVTILSGDLNGDDGPSFANNGDNSYHVVTGNSLDASAVLDGFTVTGGNANGSYPDYYGGGMLNNNRSSPTVSNVIFNGNAAGSGAGMFNNQNSRPTLTNVTFSGNAAGSGGGMSNQFASSPTLTNVIFSGNSAVSEGGGVCNYLDSAPTLTNVTFSGNSAMKGGAIHNYLNSAPTLTNVTISGNSAALGGGLLNVEGSNPVIRNSILWGDDGGEIYDFVQTGNPITTPPSITTVSYSIVQGSGGSGSGWWSANHVTDGGNNVDADPKLVTAVPSPAPSTGGNLRLQATSPAIDVGNNNVANPALPATDLDGNARIAGGTVDMGAYEAPPLVTGSVLLEDGRCCVGGLEGRPLQIHIAFTATSSVGAVTSMRVGLIDCPFAADYLANQPWQPFANSMVYTIVPPINWSGFAVAAQFLDDRGHVSPIYCDDIDVEGMPAPPLTPTITPTSMPGPPELLEPADGAALPQPVAPHEWYFRWDARYGPCWGAISIQGPGGRSITGTIYWETAGYQFHYSTDSYLPDDALGPWHWSTSVYCPMGSASSETRTFYVQSAGTPSVTHTPTSTATPTATSTVTPTPTPTCPCFPWATSTPTPTPTPTPTLTPTPPPTLPDLLVLSFYYTLTGSPGGCWTNQSALVLAVVVANQGGGDAGPFGIAVDGVEKARVNGLTAGQSLVVEAGGGNPAGPLTVFVDDKNEVLESNEGNNTRTDSVPVPTQPSTCTPTFTATLTPTATSTPTSTPTPTPTVYTVVVDPANPNGWAFSQDVPVGVGGFVPGPDTPPLGVGSAQLQVNNSGVEGLSTGYYAAVRLAQVTQLVYHTYSQSSTPPHAVMLELDMDYNLSDAFNLSEGRLVFDPALNGAVTLGTWQTWNALAGKWYATTAPGFAVCPHANPCTLAQLLAAYPNAGIRAGNSGLADPLGQLRLTAGGWGVPFLGNVDALTIGLTSTQAAKGSGPASTAGVNVAIITTYNFEPSAPTNVTVRSFGATAEGNDVTLGWETASEAGVAGFRLWRARVAFGEYEAIGPALIPSEMSANGASYTWRDTNVADGVWDYRLEAVATDGTVVGTYGPTMVVVGSSARPWPYRMFLPHLTLR